MKVYGLKQCSTTQRVIKYLEGKGYTFSEKIDIRDTPPSETEVEKIINQYDGQIKKILNTSGQMYRSLNLKEELANLDKQQIIKLLSEKGMLIKRPLIIDGDTFSVGSNEKMLDEIWDK